MKRTASLLVLFSLLLAGCAAPAASAASAIPTPTPHKLVVFAAASLAGAFGDIGKAFDAAHPGVTVTFNFAGSQALRTQLEQGASADVFASADHKNMDALVGEDLLAGGKYQDFAGNLLVVILPPNNPARILTLQDLARPGTKLDLADASVPAGNYARQALTNLSKDAAYGGGFSDKVLKNVVSNETDVKQVVAKIALGEADAGIVYVTDAQAAPDLKIIPIPNNFNVIAKYPIAVLARSPNSELAASFMAYVLSPNGQAVMKKWGFAPAE